MEYAKSLIMPGKTGRSSDYAYGRSKETKIGRIVKDISNGSSFRRTPGSRGPSDLTSYKKGTPAYSVQVKSSRASTKSPNKISQSAKNNLIKESKSKGTVPLIAHTHGTHHVIKYAVSGKTFHAG
jgi:hypothetical protein